jgi:hypothetical protein
MSLAHWKRALSLGFLSWLLPFAFGFVIFPLKKVNPGLFETLMSLCLAVVVILLGRRYFQDAVRPHIGEAVVLGFVWVVINLIFDYPMFGFGPMQMTAAHYYSDIGTDYLVYPLFLAGGVWAFRPRGAAAAQ